MLSSKPTAGSRTRSTSSMIGCPRPGKRSARSPDSSTAISAIDSQKRKILGQLIDPHIFIRTNRERRIGGYAVEFSEARIPNERRDEPGIQCPLVQRQ